jgi:hypothetical protein
MPPMVPMPPLWPAGPQAAARDTTPEAAGLGNSPRTVLEELARIQSHDVVLPTATHGQIRLRCVTQPDPAQEPARVVFTIYFFGSMFVLGWPSKSR